MSDVIITRGVSPILSGKTMDEKEFKPCWLITDNQQFKPPKTGNYRVFCVGAGSPGNASKGYTCGSGGGVGVLDIKLNSSNSYNCNINNHTFTTTYNTNYIPYSNFDNKCIAYGGYTYLNGSSPETVGGYAVGTGVISFNGSAGTTATPGSVGLYIQGMMSNGGGNGGGIGIFGGDAEDVQVHSILNGNDLYTKSILTMNAGLGAGRSAGWSFASRVISQITTVPVARGGGGFGGGGGCYYNSEFNISGEGGNGCILIQYLD